MLIQSGARDGAIRRAGATAGRRPTLLLVEDDDLLQLLLALHLEEAGFDVAAASDGGEALSRMTGAGAGLDGLVTDIGLGAGPDGWAVAREARRQAPGLPVIYMTADRDPPGPRRAWPGASCCANRSPRNSWFSPCGRSWSTPERPDDVGFVGQPNAPAPTQCVLERCGRSKGVSVRAGPSPHRSRGARGKGC